MAEVDTTTKPGTQAIPTEPVKNIDNSTAMNVCDKKEEEQPTTHSCITVPQQEKSNNPAQEEPAPTEPQATSTTASKPEPATQTESELLAAGTKLIAEEKYEEAVPLLSNALEIIQTKNMATGIESAKYYMAYGEALLRFIQSSNDLFAAPVRESQQQHIEEQQEGDEEDAPPLVTDATEQAEAVKESEAPKEAEINGKEEQDEDEDDDLNQEQEQEQEPEQAEEAKPVGGDVDTSEDREIAWETFEYARTIIEEYLNKPENSKNNLYLKMLALCHSFLGELLIEDENNELALLEFEKALQVQDKCGDGFIKCRQRAFNHFMACLAAQFCEKDQDALKHCNVALQGLSERICEILKHYGCTEEFKENNDYEQVIKVCDEFMMKLNEEQKKEEQGKELKELVGVMGDLCAKLEEVEETIKLRKEQADGNHNNDDGGNEIDLANMDPFQALIMGLTDKFNIDQEALAGMNDMDEEVDENKNTANNGVTTIGFGDVKPVDDNEEINDLGNFGVKRKEKKEDIKAVVVEDKEVEDVKEKVKEVVVSGDKKIGKKRSMEDADIDGDDGMMNGNAKKMKLNSGDAAAVENGDGN